MKELVVTVSSKGQVVIPKEVRKHLGIEQGTKVTFVLETKGKVTLKATKYSTIASLRGAAGRLATPLTWEEMRAIAHEDHFQETQQTL